MNAGPQVAPPPADPEPRRAVGRARDRSETSVVLPTGLVLPSDRSDRPARRSAASRCDPDDAVRLLPGATTQVRGNRLEVSFDVLPDDVVRTRDQVQVTRTRRTVEVDGDEATLVGLVSALASRPCLRDWLEGLSPRQRCAAQQILVELRDWGAVVPATGARARTAHDWSMRGADAQGTLTPAAAADLAFADDPSDHGDRRAGATLPLPPLRPFPHDSLSEILHRRRSVTRYGGAPIALDDLAQLLGGACGVTGELTLGDQRLPLRAYPSPGALYAVDVHVVTTRVDGLPDGVFGYDPVSHALTAVSSDPVDPVTFCLPDVRHVVTGAAAFLAMTMDLPRATRKYGEESYRILVAEAGCIAQNLVLVAHALGLRAGPFTGVFDRLVDQALGVDGTGRRFVVGVLVGHEVTAP